VREVRAVSSLNRFFHRIVCSVSRNIIAHRLKRINIHTGRHNIIDESYQRRRAARLGAFSSRRRELNGSSSQIPARGFPPIAGMKHVFSDAGSNGSKSASESVHVPPQASRSAAKCDSRQTAQSTFIFDSFFLPFFFSLPPPPPLRPATFSLYRVVGNFL